MSLFSQLFSIPGVIRSKRNITSSATSSRQWYGLPTGGQENAHYTYPEWTAAEFDREIHPILPDQGYLEQQHLLVAVKSVEDDESYGKFSIQYLSFHCMG